MVGLLREKEMDEFSEQSSSWKITLEPLTGNVVISEVEALMYIVLSEAYKHVLYGQLFGAPECGVAPPELVTTDFNCTYCVLADSFGNCSVPSSDENSSHLKYKR